MLGTIAYSKQPYNGYDVTTSYLLSLIPRDDSITFPDLCDAVRRDLPGVPDDQIRAALLEVIGDLSWDWDYSLGKDGDYVVSHTLKSLSLLDLAIDRGEVPGCSEYPAITPEAQGGDQGGDHDRRARGHGKVGVYDRSSAWGNAHHMNDRYSFTVAGGAAHPLNRVCGHVAKAGACQTDRTKGVVKRHLWCYDSLCPTCWTVRAQRTKEKILDRLLGGVDAWREAGRELGAIYDASFHPPRDLWDLAASPDGYRVLRKELYRVLDLAGVTGAVVIFHPFRTTDAAKAGFKAAKRRGFEGAKKGIWYWLRDRDLLGPDSGMVVFSPHWHIQFTGWLMDAKGFYEASGGWTYKKVAKEGRSVSWPVSGRMCANQTGLEKKVFYVLSHIGVMWDRVEKKRPIENVTWFGAFSSQKMKIASQSVEKVEVPPVDGDLVVEYDGWDTIYQGGEWFPVLGEAVPSDRVWVEYVMVRTYAVRDPPRDPSGDPPGDPPGGGGS